MRKATKNTVENCLCGYMLLLLLNKFQRVELLGHIVGVCLAL
jgi:hypothetical protein